MKSIPENNSGAQWSGKLIDELAFIKKHRRYPFTKKTALPFLSLLVLTGFGVRIIFTSLILHKSGMPTMVFVITTAILALIILVAAYNTYSILTFKSIATPFPASENIKLADEFLKSQQLNVYRHPFIPEVLQIISRPLGNSVAQREIMIFIADDNQILVNSHFIGQKWTVSPRSRNSRSMARQFAQWLNSGKRSTDDIFASRDRLIQ